MINTFGNLEFQMLINTYSCDQIFAWNFDALSKRNILEVVPKYLMIYITMFFAFVPFLK